jgi:hypothetical protein
MSTNTELPTIKTPLVTYTIEAVNYTSTFDISVPQNEKDAFKVSFIQATALALDISQENIAVLDVIDGSTIVDSVVYVHAGSSVTIDTVATILYDSTVSVDSYASVITNIEAGIVRKIGENPKAFSVFFSSGLFFIDPIPLFKYDFTLHHLNNLESDTTFDRLHNNNWSFKYNYSILLEQHDRIAYSNPGKIHLVRQMNTDRFSFSIDYIPIIPLSPYFHWHMMIYPIYHDAYNYMRIRATTLEIKVEIHQTTRDINDDTLGYSITIVTFEMPEYDDIRYMRYAAYIGDNSYPNHLDVMFNFDDTASDLACSTNELFSAYLNGVRLNPCEYERNYVEGYPEQPRFGDVLFDFTCKHNLTSVTDHNVVRYLDTKSNDDDFWNVKFQTGKVIPSKYPTSRPMYYSDSADGDIWDRFVDQQTGVTRVYKLNAYNSVYKIN